MGQFNSPSINFHNCKIFYHMNLKDYTSSLPNTYKKDDNFFTHERQIFTFCYLFILRNNHFKKEKDGYKGEL